MPLLVVNQQQTNNNNNSNTMTTSPTTTTTTTTDSMFNPIDLEASLGRIEDFSDFSVASERKRTHEQITPAASSSLEQHDPIDHHPPSPSTRLGVTRTSSSTPFLREIANRIRSYSRSNSNDSNNSLQLLKPYPISETSDEVKERTRLTESVDWSNGLVVNTPPNASSIMNIAESMNNNNSNSNNCNNNADQQSMMEVTVDDFILSAEEAGQAGSLNDLDARTIQDDPVGFWENTPVQQVATTLSMDTADVDMMSSVPFSVTFSMSSQDHPCIDHIDDIDDSDGIIADDAAPIRSSDMEW